jgi:hypothetical protein
MSPRGVAEVGVAHSVDLRIRVAVRFGPRKKMTIDKRANGNGSHPG